MFSRRLTIFFAISACVLAIVMWQIDVLAYRIVVVDSASSASKTYIDVSQLYRNVQQDSDDGEGDNNLRPTVMKQNELGQEDNELSRNVTREGDNNLRPTVMKQNELGQEDNELSRNGKHTIMRDELGNDVLWSWGREYLEAASHEKPIRKWGCNRMETPLVFVHIGKCGGGSVRARLAGGALNYTKNIGWHKSPEYGAYYPVMMKPNGTEEVGVMEKAYFCNSKHSNFRSTTERELTFEGTAPCNSSTPLGHMIGCPEVLEKVNYCLPGACESTSSSCRIVYVGHNLIGNEVHYLPYQVTMDWWGKSWAQLYNNPFTSVVSSYLANLKPGNANYCIQGGVNGTHRIKFPRPVTKRDSRFQYDGCSVPIFNEIDSKARQMAQNIQSDTGVSEYQENWSPIYASLPTQRITMIRDPFDFLMSKYFWHDDHSHFHCDDLENATTPGENSASNWLNKYSIEYLAYLCGEDCTVRYDSAGHDKTSIIAQMKHQAKANLRHSITVVGLLNETELFYDMVTTRVGYIDLSLNRDVVGKRHATNKETTKECKDLYRNNTFQVKIMEASPALKALVEVYNVGVEVNRFQMKELSQCTGGNEEAQSRISRLVEELSI